MNRKDFLKLLAAAPLVPLAKYLKPETLEEAMMRSEPALRELAEAATDMTMIANRSVLMPLGEPLGMIITFENNTDKDIMVSNQSLLNVCGDVNWRETL